MDCFIAVLANQPSCHIFPGRHSMHAKCCVGVDVFVREEFLNPWAQLPQIGPKHIKEQEWLRSICYVQEAMPIMDLSQTSNVQEVMLFNLKGQDALST